MRTRSQWDLGRRGESSDACSHRNGIWGGGERVVMRSRIAMEFGEEGRE